MNSSSGFTLIEILVVVIIIGTIASIVGVNIVQKLEEAKIDTTKIQITNLESGLKLFKIKNGFYPETDQGLEALVSAPSVGREVKHSTGFIDGDKIPLDGWGSEFEYIGPDQTGDKSYEIISPGPDAQLQTEDDISSKD
ncbi:MAG TPA: type II secretion system major pseudopilin GspG [Thermodesulfobacteriota bacterium]|nr:type II secretion system major pseudopilin GspG [Thermodesulfobacteriota bacterium]